MGKACFNKKASGKRPVGDLYNTPFSLVWKLKDEECFSNCLEPACGNGSIVKADFYYGETSFKEWSDINFTHPEILQKDFFLYKEWNGDIWTNPPFSLWDEFIIHAKEIATGRVCMLGRMNYFGCVGRHNSGIWDNLHRVYIFNRYPDLRTPYREDGKFHVGGHCMAWFIWDKKYTNEPVIRRLDVQEYAVLGQYKEEDKK